MTHDDPTPWPDDEGADACRLHQAFRLAAGTLPPTSGLPFTHPEAHEPGWIDKRVILQGTWWYDIRAVRHPLEDMSRDYRNNVLGFLAREAPGWIVHTMTWTLWEAIVALTTPREAADRLDLIDLLTPGWTHHTPLGRRLHELNGTTPEVLQPPPVLVGAQGDDRPEALRDDDTGRWRVTTESTSTYLIDLDHRRIRRDPGPGAAASNGGPPIPVNTLRDDHDWTDLVGLVQCRLHRSLVALDLRPEGEGYRISTSITNIERLPVSPSPRDAGWT